jgi:hypothetical protein
LVFSHLQLSNRPMAFPLFGCGFAALCPGAFALRTYVRLVHSRADFSN